MWRPFCFTRNFFSKRLGQISTVAYRIAWTLPHIAVLQALQGSVCKGAVLHMCPTGHIVRGEPAAVPTVQSKLKQGAVVGCSSPTPRVRAWIMPDDDALGRAWRRQHGKSVFHQADPRADRPALHNETYTPWPEVKCAVSVEHSLCLAREIA